MSTIRDDRDRETAAWLAGRIRESRAARQWSLADLATRSSLSRAMLSRIERGEASPTAGSLARLASAFGMTLAELLTHAASDGGRFRARADQPTWTDPATGYGRRQIFMSAALPLELVEVDLPAHAAVAMPAASYALIRQVVWVIAGRLVIVEGGGRAELEAGDSLEFGPPADCQFRNETAAACRYLVAVLRI
jgi:transcriptional regulator with XRE-family HTH domain